MTSEQSLKNMLKVVVVASGPIDHLESLADQFQNAHVVAVDGGLNHLHKLGVKPDVIIGDFDSVDKDLLDLYKNIKRYSLPTRKDQTDSEIAVDYAIDMKPDEVVLLGMTGHRLDHMITNIHLLKRFWNHDILAYVLDFYNKVYYCNGDMDLEGKIGDLLSIVPISCKVTKIKTFGLEYPLNDETLYIHESRGVSNVFSNTKVRIETGSGEFFIILSKD